jgi:hypothetical protein
MLLIFFICKKNLSNPQRKNILRRTTESTGLSINLLSSKKKDIDRKFFCFFFLFSWGRGGGRCSKSRERDVQGPMLRGRRPETVNDAVKARMDDHQSSTNDVHSKGNQVSSEAG